MTLATTEANLPQHMTQLSAAIQKADNVPDLQDLRTWAESLESLCRIWKKDTYTLNQALVLRLKAERKIGLYLSVEVQQGGSRYRQGILKKYGIEPKQSSRWQRLAREHDDQDIDSLLEHYGDERLVNLTTVYGLVKEYQPKEWNDDAAWGMVVSACQDYMDGGLDENRLAKAAEVLD